MEPARRRSFSPRDKLLAGVIFSSRSSETDSETHCSCAEKQRWHAKSNEAFGTILHALEAEK